MIIYAGGTPDHPNVQASFTTYHTTQGMLSDRFKYWLTLVQQERPVPPSPSWDMSAQAPGISTSAQTAASPLSTCPSCLCVDKL